MRSILSWSLALLLPLLGAAPLAAQTEFILSNSAPVQAGWLGYEVALDGDRMLVGAPGDLAGTASTFGVGAGVVYERTPTGWAETARLLPPTPTLQRAGSGVALDGDRAVVGAQTAAGTQGVAYVYEYANSTWTLDRKSVV